MFANDRADTDTPTTDTAEVLNDLLEESPEWGRVILTMLVSMYPDGQSMTN